MGDDTVLSQLEEQRSHQQREIQNHRNAMHYAKGAADAYSAAIQLIAAQQEGESDE